MFILFYENTLAGWGFIAFNDDGNEGAKFDLRTATANSLRCDQPQCE